MQLHSTVLLFRIRKVFNVFHTFLLLVVRRSVTQMLMGNENVEEGKKRGENINLINQNKTRHFVTSRLAEYFLFISFFFSFLPFFLSVLQFPIENSVFNVIAQLISNASASSGWEGGRGCEASRQREWEILFNSLSSRNQNEKLHFIQLYTVFCCIRKRNWIK